MKHSLRFAAALFFVTASALFLLAPPSAQAGLLELTLQDAVILGFQGQVTYQPSLATDPMRGLFHSESVPLAFSSREIPDGVFSDDSFQTIDFLLDTRQVIPGEFPLIGGSIVVTGRLDIDNDGIYDVAGDLTNPLLAGEIIAYGAEDSGPPTLAVNGIWQILKGPLMGSVTRSSDGVSVDAGYRGFGAFFVEMEVTTSGDLNNFSRPFTSNAGKSKLFPGVPEPSGLMLLLIGTATFGVSAVRKRRRKQPRSPGDTAREHE